MDPRGAYEPTTIATHIDALIMDIKAPIPHTLTIAEPHTALYTGQANLTHFTPIDETLNAWTTFPNNIEPSKIVLMLPSQGFGYSRAPEDRNTKTPFG